MFEQPRIAKLSFSEKYKFNPFLNTPTQTLTGNNGEVLRTGLKIAVQWNLLNTNVKKYSFEQEIPVVKTKNYSNDYKVSKVSTHPLILTPISGKTSENPIPNIDVNSSPEWKTTILSQPVSQPLTDLNVKNFFSHKTFTINLGDNLTSYFISEMAQDTVGNYWIGSYSGLLKYDGANLKAFTVDNGLPTNEINSVSVDSTGRVWIGFFELGIGYIEGDKLLMLENELKGGSPTNITHGPNNCTYFSYGVEDLGAYSIVTQLTPTNITHIDLATYGIKNATNLNLLVDRHAALWIASYQGVYKYLNNNLYLLEDTNISPQRHIWGTRIKAMVGSDDILIGTLGKGFIRLDFTSKSMTQYLITNTKNRIHLLEIIDSTSYYVGDQYSSVCYVNESDDNLTSTELSDVKTETVSFVDHGSRLWISAGLRVDKWSNLQIIELTKGGTKKFHNPTRIDNPPFNIQLDNLGRTWVQYLDRIEMRDKDSNITFQFLDTSFTNIDQPASLYIRNMCVMENGEVYVSRLNLLYKISGNKVFKLDLPCLKNVYWIKDIAEYKNELWISTDVINLKILNDSVFAIDSTLEEVKYMSDIFPSESEIWCTTFNQGLIHIQDDSLTLISEIEGLPDNFPRSLQFDSQNRIWICFPKGIAIIDDENIAFLSDKEGFGNSFPFASHQVDSTLFIIQTSQKTFLVELSDNLEIKKKEIIQSFDKEFEPIINRKPSDYFVLDAEKDNRAYLSLNVKHVSVPPNINPPRLNRVDFSGIELSETLKKHEDVVLISDNNSVWNYKAVLPYDRNSGKFEFSSSFQDHNGEPILYSYYLDGIDNDWSKPSNDNSCTYRNLGFGNYSFMVVQSRDGINWSDPVIFNFQISRPWYHTWWSRFGYVSLSFIVIFGIVRFRTRRLLQRQAELELKIDDATIEIREQRDEILDSINYAKRIQSAILPPGKLVLQHLKNSFILYKPKDIVAGDFYWMEHADGKVFFAAADCTGHGVPGAMVSVVCNNALNRSVREYGMKTPGEILDKTKELVIQEFEKSEDEVKDGMDIALCCLEGNKLSFAGAHNPLWIVRNLEIIEIKGDKQPIGKFEFERPFTTHEIDLLKGDTLYIFSDGYPDQFGGDKGKKYKTGNLKKLLLSIQEHSMEKQRSLLNEEFETWRGSIEQIDDVCIIGVRI